jgi:metal-responsive CopG/Arc/MetJ family transcriptional regulator
MTKACVTVSLPDDVLDAIDEIRAREERTRSQVMARLLRAGLAVVPKPLVQQADTGEHA